MVIANVRGGYCRGFGDEHGYPWWDLVLEPLTSQATRSLQLTMEMRFHVLSHNSTDAFIIELLPCMASCWFGLMTLSVVFNTESTIQTVIYLLLMSIREAVRTP